jgi:hypothetical protein
VEKEQITKNYKKVEKLRNFPPLKLKWMSRAMLNLYIMGSYEDVLQQFADNFLSREKFILQNKTHMCKLVGDLPPISVKLCRQGDQIGRIFVYWTTDQIGQFFFKLRTAHSSPKFWANFLIVLNMTQTGLG